MPKVSVYNQEGKTVGELALADAIFGVKPEAKLIHEVVIAARANARQAIANTKTRGEVRGGGKKPWAQKGTGRARQGSSRSPIWVGGGITFGPTNERNYSLKVNKKAKRKALFMVLTDKLLSKRFVVLDALKSEPAKTKTAVAALKKLPVEKTVLIVASGANPMLMRMVKNLPNVKLVNVQSLNMLDVMAYRTVIFMQDAVPVFEKIYQD